MAAPAITWGTVQRGTSFSSYSQTVNGTNIPTGNPGDLLLAFLAQDGATVLSVAGWTAIIALNNTSRGVIYAKIATGSDTFTNGTAFANDYVIQYGRIDKNQHGVTHVNDIGVVSNNNSTANANPSAVTGNQGTQDYLILTSLTVDTTTAAISISAAPSGYTSVVRQASDQTVPNATSTATGGACLLGVASLAGSAISSADPGAWTSPARPWAALTIAIPPSNGSPGLIPRGASTTTTGSSATTTRVSDTFTPTAGNLLVVGYNLILNSTSSVDVVLTDSFGDTGGTSWTYIENNNVGNIAGGYTVTCGFAYRRVGTGASSGAMTATRSPSGTLDQTFSVSFSEIYGQNYSTPIAQSNNATTNSGTSLACSLGATPATTSLVMANAMVVATPAPTNPSGYRTYTDLPTTHGSRVVTDAFSAAQTVSWSWGSANGAVAATIEIAKASTPKVETLVDDFEDNNLLPLWTNTGGLTASETGGLLTFPIANSYNAVVQSTNLYNLIASSVFIEVNGLPTMGNDSGECYFEFSTAAGANVLWIMIISISGVRRLNYAYRTGNGGTVTYGTDIAYNAVTMKYLRFREASGTIYFEYATTPSGTWTSLGSVLLSTVSWASNDGNVVFFDGYYSTTGTVPSGNFTIASINTYPSVAAGSNIAMIVKYQNSQLHLLIR